jgi:uncharacterized protein (DUF488 family)
LKSCDLVLTIGHSNRSLEDFLGLLKIHRVDLLVDVRSMPRSRYNPQFNRETLPGALAPVGVEYFHMPGLGGLRQARPDSENTGWTNKSFRGYADYMQTGEFEKNLADLQSLEKGRTVAIMCAEAVPWRCHRSLIADALTVRGAAVEHIMSAARPEPHRLTAFARVEGERVTYPSEQLPLTSEK